MPRFPAILVVTWVLLAYGARVAYAQDTISFTAAWSSQIIAFWGAIALGTRSSKSFQFTNGVGSIIGLVGVVRRALAIRSSLASGRWYYISSGYNCDHTRVDIVCICWRNQAELLRLALRIAMLAETTAKGRWVITVTGRRLKGNTVAAMAYWTQCPRSEDFSTVRIKGTGEPFYPITNDAIEEAVMAFVSGSADPNPVITFITSKSNQSATRVAYITEVPTDVQHCATLARHVTSWKDPESGSPFITISNQTSTYGLGRNLMLNCATIVYSVVHLTISVAVGLMAASTRRGLAVWLLTPRLVVRQLIPNTYCGDETLFTLVAFDGTQFHLETPSDTLSVGGDATFTELSWTKIFFALSVYAIELGCISGGWVYGSLKTERFAPTGLEGHGMLWLATIVGVVLAIRALFGVRKRVGARLIGIFYQYGFTQFVVPSDCTINPNTLSRDSADPFIMLQLVATILNDADDDIESIAAGLALMRKPHFGGDVELFAISSIFGFEYDQDCIIKERGPTLILILPRFPERQITTDGEYPWRQILCCVIVTVCGAACPATYAYVGDLPQWFKQIVEVGVAIAVVWFSDLDRTSKLPHSHETYMSYMVASLVVCSVWYVGVKGAG